MTSQPDTAPSLTPKQIIRLKLLNDLRLELSSQYDSTGLDCCQYLLNYLEGEGDE